MTLRVCLNITQGFSYSTHFATDPKSNEQKWLVIAKNIHFVNCKSFSFWLWDSKHLRNVLHISLMFVYIGLLVILLYYCTWIVLSLMSIIKRVKYAIHVNCIEDTQCNLKTLIPVLKKFVTLTIKVSFVSIVTTINTFNGKILTLVWLENTLNVISVYL